MAKLKQFNKKLEKLFKEWTHRLRGAIQTHSRGRIPSIDKVKIDKTIKQLQHIASEILINRDCKKEFEEIVSDKTRWHTKNKGWGWDKRKDEFNDWFKKKNINFKNYIYVFWAGNKCKYVGKSIAGRTRPQTHFEKRLINGVTLIAIYFTSQRTQIPKLECLAIHRFKPSKKYNKYKPSFSKHDKPCPVCENEDLIKQEIKSTFRLR